MMTPNRLMLSLCLAGIASSCQTSTGLEDGLTSYEARTSVPGGIAPAQANERRQVKVEMELFELPTSSVGGIETADVLTSPTVLVYEGQRASISVMNQQAYVSHFEVTTSDKAMLADPVVEVFQDGVVMDVIPLRMKDGRLGGGLSVSFSQLEKFEEVQTEILPGAPPVTIQVPRAETRSRNVMLNPNDSQRWFIDLGSTTSGSHLMIRVSMQAFDPASDAAPGDEQAKLLIHPSISPEQRAQVPMLADIPLLEQLFTQPEEAGTSEKN